MRIVCLLKQSYRLSCCLLLLLFSSTSFADHTPFTIAINKDAPPTPAIKVILEQAYKKIGIDIRFKVFSHKRSVIYANQGLADAEAFRVKAVGKKFKNLLLVDVPLRQDDMNLYVQRGKVFPVNGFASIPKHYVVGYQRGVLFAEYGIKEHQLQGQEFTSVEQVAHHLKVGRSDAVILGRISESLFSQFDRLNIVKLEPPIRQTVLYHFLHQRNEHLLAPLSKVLQEMKDSGELDDINQRIKIYDDKTNMHR